ncbi:MAG: class II aldolase/adducin family protein [Anaerolineaceae bacterium]|nr:class II aldolase/adducin family protein [Anaerolineaceae bacterium]
MNDLELNLRIDLCEAGRRLYTAGLMPGSDGNLSAILSNDEILVTPSRLCKGFLKPDQIVKIDRQGNQLSGDFPPSIEVRMHLAAYQERPDIFAVAHCHPPILVAFTVAGLNLPAGVLPEIELMFGGALPLAVYAAPGSRALADSIREIIREPGNSAVLLDHHGILAVGQDIFQAVIKVEHAEAAAKVIYYASQLGQIKPLSTANIAELHESRKRLSAGGDGVKPSSGQMPGCELQAPVSAVRNDTGVRIQAPVTQSELEMIVKDVLRKVLKEG